MSSPLGGMFDTMLSELSDHNEFSAFISNDQRSQILKGLFDGYYGTELGADVIFDTNRVWSPGWSRSSNCFRAARS